MSYKVPDEETVSSAIRTVMDRNPHIETQTEFLRLVRKELSKKNKDFRAGTERIRRIGLENGIVKISIEYRGTDIKDLPHTCPVCRNAMSPVMNRSLEGEYVEIKRKCTVCSYAVGKTVLVPGRYVFSKVKGGEVSPKDASLRKLRKAGARMREAADLINEAVGGTDLEERGTELAADLLEKVESAELSTSIKNISLDIKEGKAGPVWTRPMSSIKNSDRKDI